MTSKISIAALKHQVYLCTMNDVVTDGEGMRLSRTGVFRAWAAIEAKRGSMYAPTGVVIEESRATQSHLITIRYRYDFEISSAAWLYEEPLKSPPRWYKVLKVKEACSEWWTLSCRLVEKSDFLSKPIDGTEEKQSEYFVGMPEGLKL